MNGKTLIAITPDYLETITTGIRQQVADGFHALKSHLVEKPLTKKEAADFLCITVKGLESRIRKGNIPGRLVHKNGGTPYFFASELQELIKRS